MENNEISDEQDIPSILSDNFQDEYIFDDFLQSSYKIRIKGLTSKVSALTEALQNEKSQSKFYKEKWLESKQKIMELDNGNEKLCKQVSSLQNQLSVQKKARQKEFERIVLLTKECAALQKNLNENSLDKSLKQLEGLNAQLNKARSEGSELRKKMKDMEYSYKEEISKAKKSEALVRKDIVELNKTFKTMKHLIGKQSELINVLMEQKNNIAAAKAIQCLEKKFLELIKRDKNI